LQYLCDGAADCLDGYDEDSKLCTAAIRPPVEETASFLNNMLSTHGVNYLEGLFGRRARHSLRMMGGVDQVSIALSGRFEIFVGRARHSLRMMGVWGWFRFQ
jgi:hypothetical protein